MSKAQDILTFTKRTVTVTNLEARKFRKVELVRADLDGLIWKQEASGGQICYTNLHPDVLESLGISSNRIDIASIRAGILPTFSSSPVDQSGNVHANQVGGRPHSPAHARSSRCRQWSPPSQLCAGPRCSESRALRFDTSVLRPTETTRISQSWHSKWRASTQTWINRSKECEIK